MKIIALFLTLLSVGSLISTFGLLWIGRSNRGSEDWRDKPPALFKITRPIVNLFVERIAKNMSPQQYDQLKARLDAGGVTYAISPEEFIATRRVSLVIATMLFVYFYRNLNLESYQVLLLGLIIPLGYYYPDIWLRDATKRRHSLIEKQFPFFLDLLVLTMRAGLNFSSAMAHSVEKMAPGPVREEFGRMIRETRTGVPRSKSLTDIAGRVNMPAVTNFVSVVNQAEEVGGELGEVLAAQAEQRRKERFLKAEKLANQAPMKMLFPLIGFLFPITFIIVMFPIVIKGRDMGLYSLFGN